MFLHFSLVNFILIESIQSPSYSRGWGFGNALFVATALTAIVTLSKNGTAKAIILYEAAIGLGISVGPLLGGELGGISWRGPFIGVGVLMVIAFIFLITLMPNSKKKEVTQSKAASSSSILDPFRAMKHRSIVVFGLTTCFYNFGFFTLLAYAPFVMGLDAHGIGYVFIGWGALLAITSVFMAPKLQKRFGTVNSMCVMLTTFAVVLLVMGIWSNTQWVIIAAVIFAGALLGNNNTLITTAVMNAAPIERSTASTAYSFLRFLGGAIAPYLAGKLAEWFSPHVPFIVGGCFVLISVIFVLMNRHHVNHIDSVEASH